MKILSLLFCIHAFASGGGIFVGNGGDGVDIDGHLYLRDLFNLGVHQAPYFGQEVDGSLLPLSSAFSFPIPEHALAVKLTDMNRAAPGLGDFAKLSFTHYTWTLIDLPLTKIEDPNDSVVIPPGASIMQIANRRGNAISINRQSWERLDDSNKVALLIHEAVFSLVRPVKNPNNTFSQSAARTREFTGNFFLASYFATTHDNYADLASALAIPQFTLSPSERRRSPSWVMGVASYSSTDRNSPGLVPRYFSFDFHSPLTGSNLEGFLNLSCVEAEKKIAPGRSFILTSTFTAPRIVATLFNYPTGDPNFPRQPYLSISAPPNLTSPSSTTYEYKNSQDCLDTFAPTVENIETYLH